MMMRVGIYSLIKDNQWLPKFFEKLMTTKKLYIDENLFVGAMAGAPLHIYAHPEWNIDWMKSEMQRTNYGSILLNDLKDSYLPGPSWILYQVI